MKEFQDWNLHSTMFLLIRNEYQGIPVDSKFTFHNVSINTVTANNYFKINTGFTFHNVSINTVWYGFICKGTVNLHSTMFLLIHLHG